MHIQKLVLAIIIGITVILASVSQQASAENAERLRIAYKDYPTPFYQVFSFNKKVTQVRAEQYLAPGPTDRDEKSGLEELVKKLMEIEGVDYVKVSAYEVTVHFSEASEPWKFKGNVQTVVKDYFRGRGFQIRFFPAPE